jgi:hypothetical protein
MHVTRSRSDALDQVELIAWLLDNSIPIPGTGRRIGLDGIIGLVPGVGDLLAAGVSVLVVVRAAQLNLPRIVLVRMLANIALDLGIGAIPVVGDAFDLWFKASTRNLDLLRRYLTAPESSTRGQWLFFGGLMLATLAVVAGFLWLLSVVIGWLFGL